MSPSKHSESKSFHGSCIVCQRQTSLFCQRCSDFYCSVECQLKDWNGHRYICFPIPKLIDGTQSCSQLHPEIQPLMQSYNLMQPPRQPLIPGPPMMPSFPFVPTYPVPPQHQFNPYTNYQNQNAPTNNVTPQQGPSNVNQPQQPPNNTNQNTQKITTNNVVPQQAPSNFWNPRQPSNNSNLKTQNVPTNKTVSQQAPCNMKKPQQSSNNYQQNQNIKPSQSNQKNNSTVSPSKETPISNKPKDFDEKSYPTLSSKVFKKLHNQVLTNPSLTSQTNETLEKLERLRILQSKNINDVERKSVDGDSNNDDCDEVDPSTLSFLKTIADSENSKIEREKSGASSLSRSSSLKSICPNLPSDLQGKTRFPESGSLCIINGMDPVSGSVFIRPCYPVATKEYNDIIEVVAERGPQCPGLGKQPKLGDQVLAFHKRIYCRALVVNYVSINEILLFFIDTGEQDSLKLGDLRTMPSEFKKLKKYVFNIKLKNCKGNFGSRSQKFMQGLIDNEVQIRLEYSGSCSTVSCEMANIECDLFNYTSNVHINEFLNQDVDNFIENQ